MTQATERKPSPILAMHARYEAADAEYQIVERAESNARKDKDEAGARAYDRALKALSVEADALRFTILLQVPTNWVEAMILQFHIVCAGDMLIGSDRPEQEGEYEALQTAIDTLFDFMCCEVDQDHGEIGASFRDGAVRVFYQRRRRTGIVEA